MTTITTLYAGNLRTLEPEGQQTGIYKEVIQQAEVNKTGIIGDHQADLRIHGGVEKALHQYARNSYLKIIEAYPLLKGCAVPGSLGENISAPDMTEQTVCIGDIFRMGEVLVQVSQPRRPCWKINHRFHTSRLSVFIEQQRINGWYYRVLETGKMQIGDTISLVDRFNEGVSVDHFLTVANQHRPNLQQLEVLAHCKGLNSDWAERLKQRQTYLATLSASA